MERSIRRARLLASIHEAGQVISALVGQVDVIESVETSLARCLEAGGRVYLFGNGGSAAIADHAAAEFVGRFQTERRPLPAVSLGANAAAVTAIANDYGVSEVFSRQVRAFVGPDDCVVGMSTSGLSPNVLEALAAARALGATTIGFGGGSGGRLGPLCDSCLLADATSTPRIQEAHLLAWHLVCEALDDRLTG
jgi:D-sedoheptulose 7-phosphate isomerase